MAELLTVVLIGIIVWNCAMKLRVIGLLAQRAVQAGTVRGYWSDYFTHCAEGHYSRLFALVVSIPAFVVLLAVVPIVARRRRHTCREAFELLLRELRAEKPPAVAMQAAQTFLIDRGMSSEHASNTIDAFVERLVAAETASHTSTT